MNFRSAKEALTAFADQRTRGFAIGLIGLFWALAILPLLVCVFHDFDRTSRIVTALVSSSFVGTGTAFLWLHYPYHGLNLMRNAHALRMPSVARPVFEALLALYAVTVVAPALLLGLWGGAHLLDYLGAFTCAAFGGLLVPSIPRPVFVRAWPPVLLVAIALQFVTNPTAPIAMPRITGVALTAAFWIAAMVLGGLLAACWRYHQVREGEQTSLFDWMKRPTGKGSGSSQAVTASARVSLARIDPSRPVDAIRACLNLGFTSYRGKGVLAGWLKSVLSYGFYVVMFGKLVGWHRSDAFVVAGASVGGMALACLYALPAGLRAVFSGRKGDLGELALLPGWGDARSMSGALTKVIGRYLLVCWVWLVAAALLTSYWVRLAPLPSLVVASALLALLVERWGTCVYALVSSRRLSVVKFLVMVPLVPASGFAIGAASGTRPTLTMIVVAYWCVFAFGMGMLWLHSWRRLIARPHPFLPVVP